MARPLTHSQITSLESDLHAFFELLDDGELESNIAMRHRIEGALTMLRVVLGKSPLSEVGLPRDWK